MSIEGQPADALNQARQDAGLSEYDLWLRYFANGGMTPELELEAILYGALQTTDDDRNNIAHTLNERFTELGRNHPIPYSDDDPPHKYP